MSARVALALALGLAGTAHAGGLAVGQQTAVSAGTGGAGAGRDDDPGAAWHAPAALADDGGLRLGLSLVLAHPRITARAADGTWTTDSEGQWSTPPHLDASVAQGAWAGGLTVGVPFGGGVAWPATWPGATEAVASELRVLRAAPFVARRLGPLRLAVGVHLDAARLQVARNLDFIDADGDVRIDLDGTGVGLDASAYYTPRADTALALTYRGRTRLDLDGNANFTAPDAFAGKAPDQGARTTMTMPDVIVLGARYRRGAVTALVDVEHTRWSVNRATTITFASAATDDAVQRNDWGNTTGVRAGAEWKRRRLVVRGGGYVDPSPVPTARLSPASPDGHRLGLTAGASYAVSPAWSADAFAEHLWILRRETTSPEASPTTMAASYGGRALVLGVGLRFTR